MDQSALAQDVTELPPVVVEGATVDKPKVTVKDTSGGDKVTGPSESVQPATQADTVPDTRPATQTVTGVDADHIGTAVSVVTAAELKAQQIRTAADALRSLPGVEVSQAGSAGGLIQVRIRGAEGNHTLVMIDGIEASNSSSNEFDWSNLLADDIDRIEVIRGGQSGIYGSKAIGGVINVITRSGKGPIAASARTEFGGYGTKDVSARVSGGTDRFWLALSAGYRAQNDFNWDIWGSEDDPWQHSTLNVRGGATLLPGMVLDFSLRKSNKFANTDADTFGPRPQSPHNSAIDAANTSEDDLFLGGLNLRWDSFGGAFTQLAKANRNTLFNSNFAEGPFGGTATNDSIANTFSYLATYRFSTPGFGQAQHSVSGFIEKKDEEFTPVASFTDGLARHRSYVATVGEYRLGLFDHLFLAGSVRRDDNDNYVDFTTWHTDASLNLHEIGVRPHASAGTSVALPGMFEQFGTILGEFVGNPNLTPEQSFGWDAGIEITVVKDRATIDVTYFEADLTDKIAGFGTTLINLPGVSHRSGVELSGRVMVFAGLSLGATYTFLNATDPAGAEEVRRPKNAGRGDANYSFDGGRGNFNIAAIYNGEMNDTDFATFPAGVVTMGSYWLVNAAASYKLSPQAEIFGRVENLLDERYQEVLGYNTLGIAAYGGIRVSLEDPSTAAWARYK